MRSASPSAPPIASQRAPHRSTLVPAIGCSRARPERTVACAVGTPAPRRPYLTSQVAGGEGVLRSQLVGAGRLYDVPRTDQSCLRAATARAVPRAPLRPAGDLLLRQDDLGADADGDRAARGTRPATGGDGVGAGRGLGPGAPTRPAGVKSGTGGSRVKGIQRPARTLELRLLSEGPGLHPSSRSRHAGDHAADSLSSEGEKGFEEKIPESSLCFSSLAPTVAWGMRPVRSADGFCSRAR